MVNREWKIVNGKWLIVIRLISYSRKLNVSDYLKDPPSIAS
jgi:hypothetical protein